MSKNVLVIGGLGFIGYHIVKTLQELGYEVTIGSRSKLKSEHALASIIHIDLDKMNDEDLSLALKGYQVIIFAGGVDDRKIHKRGLNDYYYKGNVMPCLRLGQMSQSLDIEHIVILGSYFSYFDRAYPEWQMTRHHPYVKSRLLQRIETQQVIAENTQLTCLEIPYVFGSAPGLIPLWQPLLKYISATPIVFYTKGGTNICAVEQVAGAVRGILSSPEKRDHWIVGGENVTWKQMIGMMAVAMGKKRRVVSLPDMVIRFAGALTKLYFRLRGKQSGLDAYHFVTTQVSNTYLDTHETRQLLGYKKMDLQESIRQTVEACEMS